MNWEAIGAIAESVGAVGVVATLIYLARQVALSNRLARAEASRTPISNLNALNASFGTLPRFNAAFRRVAEGAKRAEFDPDDRLMLDAYWASVANVYEQRYREVKEGILDEEALDFAGRGIFDTPFVTGSWSLYRPYFGSSFVRFFEEQHDFEESPEIEL